MPAGLLLIERGHAATRLYMILEGSVIVEAAEGTRKLGPGAVVGERALRSTPASAPAAFARRAASNLVMHR